MPDLLIFTVGHSNHALETLLAHLQMHQIRCLVDVRSAPYSRYSPHFSKQSLEASLGDADISYVYKGDVLGGRPDDPACYDELGKIDYPHIARQPWFEQGLQELLQIAQDETTAIMCSEEDPEFCHRNRLIADTLLRRSLATVQHIRGDGRLEPADLTPQQTRLF